MPVGLKTYIESSRICSSLVFSRYLPPTPNILHSVLLGLLGLGWMFHECFESSVSIDVLDVDRILPPSWNEVTGVRGASWDLNSMIEGHLSHSS